MVWTFCDYISSCFFWYSCRGLFLDRALHEWNQDAFDWEMIRGGLTFALASSSCGSLWHPARRRRCSGAACQSEGERLWIGFQTGSFGGGRFFSSYLDIMMLTKNVFSGISSLLSLASFEKGIAMISGKEGISTLNSVTTLCTIFWLCRRSNIYYLFSLKVVPGFPSWLVPVWNFYHLKLSWEEKGNKTNKITSPKALIMPQYIMDTWEKHTNRSFIQSELKDYIFLKEVTERRRGACWCNQAYFVESLWLEEEVKLRN